jgi:putative SOS response-associated peptidase YedK
MCNLYAYTTTVEAMRRLFDVRPGLDRLGNAPPRPAIHPNYPAPVVRRMENGDRELIEMNWGFLTPNFSKRDGSPIKPRAWNNARDDKVMHSGLWKASFHERRCLLPASSYNETKGKKPAEHFWFGLTTEDPDTRPPFAIAGLWRIEHEDLHLLVLRDRKPTRRHAKFLLEALREMGRRTKPAGSGNI